ncbi:DUF421 domain-containing protein [Sporosarcina cascadiensis]|uniref:DUF421 domain-containing protein n=1 Tax=Sporosarcina cascadiensis TaxID=2660747 RepID=UPI00129B0153|nr:YetF domain-containing protein [Sporosarcina cascadiensis]
MEAWLIGLKLVSGFLALVFCMKMTGAKGVSNLTSIDFIWSILLSEIVGNGLYDTEVKWYTVLLTLLGWCLIKMLFDYFMYKSDKIEVIITGERELLIKDGQPDRETMRKNRIDKRELEHALRKQGVFSMDEIQRAYLEMDGAVTIQLKKDYQTATKGDLQSKDLGDV